MALETIQARIVTAEGGQIVLFYTEPEADRTRLHMITAVQGIGQADVGVMGPEAAIQKMWEAFVEDDFKKACEGVLTTVAQIEAKLGQASVN